MQLSDFHSPHNSPLHTKNPLCRLEDHPEKTARDLEERQQHERENCQKHPPPSIAKTISYSSKPFLGPALTSGLIGIIAGTKELDALWIYAIKLPNTKHPCSTGVCTL